MKTARLLIILTTLAGAGDAMADSGPDLGRVFYNPIRNEFIAVHMDALQPGMGPKLVRFDQDGEAVAGGTTTLVTTSKNTSGGPDMAIDLANERALVVWNQYDDVSQYRVRGRFYDLRTNEPVSSTTFLFDTGGNVNGGVSVEYSPVSRRYLVVWIDNLEIKGRWVNSDGSTDGLPTLIDDNSGYNIIMDVRMAYGSASDNFMIAWYRRNSNPDHSIKAVIRTPVRTVASVTAFDVSTDAVFPDPFYDVQAGTYKIAWMQPTNTLEVTEFTSAGVIVGQVNIAGADPQATRPSVLYRGANGVRVVYQNSAGTDLEMAEQAADGTFSTPTPLLPIPNSLSTFDVAYNPECNGMMVYGTSQVAAVYSAFGTYEGNVCVPTLAASPPSLDFGTVGGTTGSDQDIDITAQLGALQITDVQLNGSDAFTLSANDCSGTILNHGDACKVMIRAMPARMVGAQTSTLMVNTAEGPAINVVVTGVVDTAAAIAGNIGLLAPGDRANGIDPGNAVLSWANPQNINASTYRVTVCAADNARNCVNSSQVLGN